MALESKAHFLAVAEHRLVPTRARITTQLRKTRRSSVWAPTCQDVTPGGHAGVGVISLPTLFDPSFKEFFRLGRALRVVLPLENGGIAHLFVIYGYQGAENDPEKLTLTDNLLTAVLAEAKVCCAGQPVILVGDLNADPTIILSLAQGIMNGHWIDVDQAFAIGRGVAPARTCQFQLDEDKGSRRDFTLACPIAMAATTACCVLPDRWFTRTLPSSRSFRSLHGTPLFIWPESILLSGQPVWSMVMIDKRSPSPTVQNIWDVHIREVSFDVDASWCLWSREIEACLARAYVTAGGPALLSPGSYVGRGKLSLRTKRLGGRCRDRIYCMNRADEFDVTHSGFFVNSSLAPVLRFRRRFVSVCNVLKGTSVHGFSDARVTASWRRRRAVVRMGPTGPVTSFEPWTHWIPPDLHGFFLSGLWTP